MMAQWLSERLGQQVIVENKPGAGGNIATEIVVRSAPDGYTLTYVGPVAAINPALYKDLGFNFIRDIAPVARAGSIQGVNCAQDQASCDHLYEPRKACQRRASTTSGFMSRMPTKSQSV
jgi:tripartite-type tricarboxylate transporter receptor subunit TctC